MGNLKLSKTAIRELTRLYRGVLVAAIVAATLTVTNAKAADTVSVLTGVGTTTVNNVATSTDASTVTGTVNLAAVDTTANTTTDVYTTDKVDSLVGAKQNKLTHADNAGSGISISSAGVISLAEGGVGQANIASNAITTGKIEDGNVTKQKLATDVQTSLGKADTALQADSALNGAKLTDGTVSLSALASGVQTSLGKADTALQAGDNISVLTNDAGYQTASDVSTAIGTAITFTADGKNYASGDTALQAIKKLDTVIGDANSGLTKGVADNAAAITALTTDTSTGTINVSAANVGGAANVGSLAIGTTGKGFDTEGNATVKSLNAGSGKIETTGSLAAGDLEVTGASVLKGTVTIGHAYEINGSTTGTIDMNKNTLTGIQGLTLTDSSDNTATLSVNDKGFLTGGKNLDVGAGTLTGNTLSVTTAGVSGTATVGSLAIGATGKGIDNTGAATLTSVKIGSSGTMTGVDDGSSPITSGSGTVFASTATVLNSAQNGTFTPASGAANVASATTLNGAITALDGAIGSRSSLGSANAAINTGTAASVAAGLKAAGDAIGDLKYTAPSTVNYTAPAANTALTTAVAQIAKNVGTATELATTGTNGVDSTKTVNYNINAVNATIGNIASLAAGTGSTGDAITNGTGTAATTVVQALNNIDATIGDIHGLQAKIQTSNPNAGKNLAAGTTVEDHLTALDASIGDRTAIASANAAINTATATSVAAGLKAAGDAIGNMTFAGTNATGSADLTAAVNALDTAIGNRTITSANTNINTAVATDVATGFTAVGNAIGDQNYTSTKYVTAGSNLTAAVSALDQNIERVEGKVDSLGKRVNKMHHEMKSGFASLAAMSALVPNARVAGDTQIAVGTGYYRGTTGFALGAFHHVNDNVLLNAGASYGGNGAAVFKGGVTFGF